MKNEIYVIGEYVSGVAKRPDLVGQPCVLVCGDDGFVLSVLSGEEGELFNFPYDNIDSVKTNFRLLVSEHKGPSKINPMTYEKLLAYALDGLRGYMSMRFAEFSNNAFNNSIGKMQYSKRQELIIEYHADDVNRRLFIYADSDPKELINYYNNIKK